LTLARSLSFSLVLCLSLLTKPTVFALIFGSLAVAFFWLILSFNLLLIVTDNVRRANAWLPKVFYVVGWGGPLVIFITPLAADKVSRPCFFVCLLLSLSFSLSLSLSAFLSILYVHSCRLSAARTQRVVSKMLISGSTAPSMVRHYFILGC
jgi:hypothetical protein